MYDLKILYVYSIKCFDDGSGEKGAPLKWTSQEYHRVVLPWAPRGGSKVDPVRSPDKTSSWGLWVVYTIAKVVCAAESQQSAFDFISVDCDLCRSGEVSFRQRKSEAAESLQLHGLLLRWQRNPGCNCDHGWGWWFPEHSHQRYFLYFQKLFSIFSIKLFSKYFHWVLKTGLPSTYRFSVLRLINVWPNFCENKDGLVETSSYKKYFYKELFY